MTLSGDGLIGAVADALRGSRRRRARRAARRPRQRLRARARHPARPAGGVRGHRRAASSGRSTSARSAGAASSASPASASTPTPTASRNEAPARAGSPRLRLRRAARAGGVEARRVHGRGRRRARGAFRGWSVARGQLQGLRRRDVPRAGRRASTTACSTSCPDPQTAELDLPARAARACSRAPTSSSTACACCAAPRCGCRPTGRSSSTPTATRSASCRSRCARCPRRCACCCPPTRPCGRLTGAFALKLAAARAAGVRVAPRRARRHLPAGQAAHAPGAATRSRGSAARLPRGSAVISATNGKTTTAAMVAAHPRAHAARGSSTTARARTWPAASPARCCGDRAARPDGGRPGLFEVDEFWLGQVVADLRPRALLLANLFRDQLDRYGELDTIADRWARASPPRTSAPPRPQRRRPDRRRPRPRRAPTPLVLRRRGRPRWRCAEMQHAADAKHCRRCGAPYRYDAIYLGHLGHYHCDACGATRARSRRSRAHDVVLEGVRGARFTLRTPAGERRVALPLPGLYNVYNALGAAALTLALGAPLDDVAAGLRGGRPRLRARRDGPRRRPRAVDPARQEPRRAPTRCCARSCSRPASTTCSPCSTTTSPTGAT